MRQHNRRSDAYLDFLRASWAALSARSLARFSRKPTRRASFQAALSTRVVKAPFSSGRIFLHSTVGGPALAGFITTWSETWVATAMAAASASPAQPFLDSLRRCTLACLPCTERLRRRGSTETPRD